MSSVALIIFMMIHTRLCLTCLLFSCCTRLHISGSSLSRLSRPVQSDLAPLTRARPVPLTDLVTSILCVCVSVTRHILTLQHLVTHCVMFVTLLCLLPSAFCYTQLFSNAADRYRRLKSHHIIFILYPSYYVTRLLLAKLDLGKKD